MFEELTEQQRQAVLDRGGSLLVSAAAGSGKTKVLVDRLLSYIMDPVDPANLDEFLIITYTKAAASELRGKIAEKLAEKIAQNPQNRHLHRQMQRLYLTKISTVHSFCSDILKENAYQLDISAEFRMAEDTECEQMQIEVLDKILNEVYENIDDHPCIKTFIDTQGLGRDDRAVPQIIQKVYLSARCHMNPQKWLQNCVDMTQITTITDAGETVWGEYLIKDLMDCAQLHLDALEKCYNTSVKTDGMDKVNALLLQDMCLLRSLLDCKTWDSIHALRNLSWERFPGKYDDKDLGQRIKAVRDNCKESLAKKLISFMNDSKQALTDLMGCGEASKGLIELVERFSESYDGLKRMRRVMDFSDLEHKTLELLLGKSRSGPTIVAKEIGQRFREIMVDEYQDSNAVQDAIFRALTYQRNNCFMVGDVKQSIYQFRLADPTIFLEKYNSYADAEIAGPGEPRKVVLSKNFRSAGQVIHAVNDVFKACMSPGIGGLIYGQNEMLHEGIPHEVIDEPEVELHVLQTQEDTYAEEAAFTAKRIAELLDGTHKIRTREGFRPIAPEDIVILLRSPGSVGLEFCYALQDMEIPCSMGGGENLLETEEISVLYALLQSISNPLQDIPLAAAVSSRMFCFTANDLAEIRAGKKYLSFYESLKRSQNEKAVRFLEVLSDLRAQARLCSTTQLIEYIFAKTKIDSIYASMEDGPARIANLQEFCRIANSCENNGRADLESFLDYMDALSQKGMVVTSDQKSTGAVSVMSIHKSKGLEFPVVFLCGLARKFNQRSAQEQVLCDKDIGLGLACIDTDLRVRYPSIAKRAIALKIRSESVSEEMRVLYVALTRAKDRLIMTYASQYLKSTLSDIAARMDMSSSALMNAYVGSPGRWILQTAMARIEAGELHAIGGHPDSCSVKEHPWKICAHDISVVDECSCALEEDQKDEIPVEAYRQIQKFLHFAYPHSLASTAPSKQTATGIKEITSIQHPVSSVTKCYFSSKYRKPTFVEADRSGVTYGNAVHTLMQHIDFAKCSDIASIEGEIQRLTHCGYLSSDLAGLIDPSQIAGFFISEIGCRLRQSSNVLREFKFSILDDAGKYVNGLTGEQVLLQGVVDCALVEDDGITVIDFKTDRVTPETLDAVVQGYAPQVHAYADALARIYQKEVNASYLYFFKLNALINVL